jgi:hypothetical protein
MFLDMGRSMSRYILRFSISANMENGTPHRLKIPLPKAMPRKDGGAMLVIAITAAWRPGKSLP